MLRSKPPSRGETTNHRTMTGNLRNQIQLWEDISVTIESDNGTRRDTLKASNKPFSTDKVDYSPARTSLDTSAESSSPNVLLRSTVT